jgi:hypothetical protein
VACAVTHPTAALTQGNTSNPSQQLQACLQHQHSNSSTTPSTTTTNSNTINNNLKKIK